MNCSLTERFKDLVKKECARRAVQKEQIKNIIHRHHRPEHRVRDCLDRDSNSAPVPIQEKKPLPKETPKTSTPKLFPDAPDDPAKRYRYYLAIAE
ncbi:hypothetical protein MPER_08675 [Moniliophthora perniciosa FA553]|nr:hypothetical protein MPER_08675 [Moniliophthora perniciosa FA553]